MRRTSRSLFLFLSLAFPLPGQTPLSFTNPLFAGQDPWVIQRNGNYYYSESRGTSIQIRESRTLTGLGQTTPRTVWSARSAGIAGMTNLWSPEVHFLNDRWYIYFSADQRNDQHHRLYVLEGGSDPFGPYYPGQTGVPNGLLPETSGRWAIDADVFHGPAGQLYLTWSCAESDIGAAPQSICIAPMADPLHVSGPTVRISTPDHPWETRTAAINEGPVGSVRNGITYITYSGSASWTTNDYAVGLLVNTTGNLLDPKAWTKVGPILDNHSLTYGPGSAVFINSPDGAETWNLYHAYDQLGCKPWSCRSIRAQKVLWSDTALPVLSYPADPWVATAPPSGDLSSPTGWGDARSGTPASGNWQYRSGSSADAAALEDFAQTFRAAPGPLSWGVSATTQVSRAGAASEYGFYPLYEDPNNYVQVFINPERRVAGTRTVVAGTDLGANETALPETWDPNEPHALRTEKSATGALSLFIDEIFVQSREVPLPRGQIGLFARGAEVQFRDVAVHDTSFGWGDAHGDAAQGAPPLQTHDRASGYARGLWDITDSRSATSLNATQTWNTLYRGNPNFGDYSVEVNARPLSDAPIPAEGGYGLVVCHDDRDNQIILWLQPAARSIDLISVIRGTYSRETLADLPDSPAHKLSAIKEGTKFSFYLDDRMISERHFDLKNGTAGLAASAAAIRFEEFRLSTEHLPAAPHDTAIYDGRIR